MSSNNVVPDFKTMVGAGYIPGLFAINKFGYNGDIDTTSDPEDVWGAGGVYTGFPTGAPETVEAFSSSDEDGDGTLTGALTIRIIGLKTATSLFYESEDITLTGQVAATSVASWYRINRMYVLTSGSAGNNVGTITVRHTTTTSNVFFVLPAGFGQSVVACWTVPHNNTFLLDRISIHMSRANNGAGSCQVALQTREVGTSTWRNREFYSITNDGGQDEDYPYPIKINGFTDVRIRVVEVGANDTRVQAGFSGCYGLSTDVRDACLARSQL
jgi:hypothetical protein